MRNPNLSFGAASEQRPPLARSNLFPAKLKRKWAAAHCTPPFRNDRFHLEELDNVLAMAILCYLCCRHSTGSWDQRSDRNRLSSFTNTAFQLSSV